jgi:uncharacterized protein (PEP-CTERM system associated)
LVQQQLAASTNSNVVTQTEHVTLTSGEDFGRVGMRLAGAATQYSGTGVYSGAFNNTASLDLAYAINRFVAAIARGGYDDIAYGGLPPVRINDPFWAAGAKLTLNADSSVTATYGNRYGKPNTYLNAAYSPTARLHIYANYSQALTTGLDDLQSTLSQVDVDTSGSVFDQQTGAPVAITNNFFGIQSGVTRLSRGSIGASLIYERDTFTLSVVRQISKQISTPVGVTLNYADSSGTYGSLTWSHDLSPNVKTSLYVQYGKTNQNGLAAVGDQDSYAFSASATYAITETLSANAMYSYSKSATISSSQSGTQNYVLVGVHKQF